MGGEGENPSTQRKPPTPSTEDRCHIHSVLRRDPNPEPLAEVMSVLTITLPGASSSLSFLISSIAVEQSSLCYFSCFFVYFHQSSKTCDFLFLSNMSSVRQNCCIQFSDQRMRQVDFKYRQRCGGWR